MSKFPINLNRAYNELLNFYNSLKGQERIAVTPDVEYEDVKMVFDILESIETNQPVEVDNYEHKPEKTFTTY